FYLPPTGAIRNTGKSKLLPLNVTNCGLSSAILSHGPFAHMGRANRVHCPVIRLPMCDEGSDADDRMVDVLRKLVADRLANFYVGLADKIVGGRKPAQVGHSLQVPYDN